MEPGDPSQVEDELMVVGVPAEAIIGLLETKRQEDRNAMVELSAVDVVDHRLARACKYSMVALLLLSQCLVDPIFLLHEAEAKQDVEAYMRAMQFLVNVFSVSHQTHYVDLNTDSATTWLCMSYSKCEIYEKLFRKTKNDCSIFEDRFVEWCVRMLRDLTGKKATGDNHKLSKQRDRTSATQVIPTEADRKSLHLDNVFFEKLLYYFDPEPLRARLMHHGTFRPSCGQTELKTPSGTSVVKLRSYSSTGTDNLPCHWRLGFSESHREEGRRRWSVQLELNRRGYQAEESYSGYQAEELDSTHAVLMDASSLKVNGKKLSTRRLRLNLG
jgi:hypothetical protein